MGWGEGGGEDLNAPTRNVSARKLHQRKPAGAREQPFLAKAEWSKFNAEPRNFLKELRQFKLSVDTGRKISMLQINTGKLYTRGIGRANALTGVLYTNARLPWEGSIDTAAGSIRSAGQSDGCHACVFEMEERIEKAEDGQGVLLSHGIGPFADDLSIVATVGLGVIFSRQADKVSALTGGLAGISSYRAPTSYIAKLYDRETYVRDEEIEAFNKFVSDLLALERKHYLGAMRAMRSFVAGIHRIQDDLALAYTLMVSAVESLAQGFDGHEATWNDVEESKRKAIDAALDGVIEAEAIRKAILSTEHVALSRRYRAFVMSHVHDDYFRQDGLAGNRPVARYELEPALRQAYALRSAYVHQVQHLPGHFEIPHDHWEITSIDRRPALTFQGLYRLSRHVIRAFVANGPKVDVEPYNYKQEEAGVIVMEMAPQYWVGRPLTQASQSVRRLEGQVSLTAGVLLKLKDATLVDLRPMLADVERILPQAPVKYRIALLSVHILFNLMVHKKQRTEGFDEFLDAHGDEANQPGPISIIVSTILGGTSEWTIEEHQKALDEYFTQRLRPKGLHAPRVFEAAACLELAEKLRRAGNHEAARATLARAVEVHPGQADLRAFEKSFEPTTGINWKDLLLPPKDPELSPDDPV
jgi:hypothetical protein